MPLKSNTPAALSPTLADIMDARKACEAVISGPYWAYGAGVGADALRRALDHLDRAVQTYAEAHAAALAAAAVVVAPASPVRFMQHYVTNGTAKVRCHYSIGTRDGVPGVTVYAIDLDAQLAAVLPEEVVCENMTDMQTDYFCKDRAQIPPGHSLYPAAMARAQANAAKHAAKYA